MTKKIFLLTGFYKIHRFIINIIVFILAFLLLINFFIGQGRFFLIGEYIFSFDYLGHLKNILTDFSTNLLYLNNTACIDCPDFYHYSRWYSLFKIGFQSLGQVLGLNPFIYILFTSVVLQITSLYIFVKTFFHKFNKYIFLITSFFFIFNPYKFSLLVETHDGVTYSFLLIFITMFYRFMKEIDKASKKKVLTYAFLIGLIVSSFFNINIGFLPIIAYLFILISVYYYKNLFKFRAKSLLFVTTIFLVTLTINFPLFLSAISFNSPYVFQNYISMVSLDALFIDFYSVGVSTSIIYCGAVVFIILFFSSKLDKQTKMKLLLGYSFIACLILGRNAIVNIYEIIFRFFPLMNMLRSLYRLFFFELLILFIISYSGLSSINLKKMTGKIVAACCGGFLFLIPTLYICYHIIDIQTGILPLDYFRTEQYLKDNNDKKIYLPSYLPIFQSMTGNYNWYLQQKKSILYKNPFTSLLSVPNLTNFERYPPTLERGQLRALTDLSVPPKEIVLALEYAGIKYVIVDKNFFWQKNFPNFDINSLQKAMHIEKKFGNLFVYSIQNLSKDCRPSYGDYKVGNCVTFDKHLKNVILVNKDTETYILERLERQGEYAIQPNKNANLSDIILSPNIQDIIIREKILLPFNAYQMDKSANIFSLRLNAGRYKLFIPIFKVTSDYSNLFLNSKMVIGINSMKIKQIIPVSDINKFYWDEVDLDIHKSDLLSIDSVGNGFLIFGNPLLIPEKDWRDINE